MQAAYPFRCDDKYFEVDSNELMASCNESKKKCSSLNEEMRNSFFKCSTIASNPNYQHKMPRARKLNCKDFPTLNNDPYPCDANYKVGSAIQALSIVLLRHCEKKIFNT